jgi:hypothetical protein
LNTNSKKPSRERVGHLVAPSIAHIRAEIDTLYRKDSRRVLATLIRLLGDFDRAEEALSDAFRAAMEKWPTDGIPQNPASWLVSAGRFKSIDKQRREKRFDHLEDRPDVSESLADESAAPDALPELPEDDQLRLVFPCCHPPPAPAYGLVRGKELVHRELRHLARQVRRDGVIRESQLELSRGPLGQGRSIMHARVAPLGSSHVLLLVEDHIKGCLAHAIETGEGEAYTDEVMTVVRRMVGRRGKR